MLLNCGVNKTLESPLDCKDIKPINPKGNQPWIFIEMTDAEAPICWPPDVNSQLAGKDPDAGKDWRQEEKGAAEDELVGWHHRLHGQGLEQTLGDGDLQGSLVCCSPWGRKESDTTEWLNKAYQNPVTTKWNPTSSVKVAKSLLFQREHSLLNSYTLPHIHTCITIPST